MSSSTSPEYDMELGFWWFIVWSLTHSYSESQSAAHPTHPHIESDCVSIVYRYFSSHSAEAAVDDDDDDGGGGASVLLLEL